MGPFNCVCCCISNILSKIKEIFNSWIIALNQNLLEQLLSNSCSIIVISALISKTFKKRIYFLNELIKGFLKKTKMTSIIPVQTFIQTFFFNDKSSRIFYFNFRKGKKPRVNIKQNCVRTSLL